VAAFDAIFAPIFDTVAANKLPPIAEFAVPARLLIPPPKPDLTDPIKPSADNAEAIPLGAILAEMLL
jgi:hypothetical protein